MGWRTTKTLETNVPTTIKNSIFTGNNGNGAALNAGGQTMVTNSCS